MAKRQQSRAQLRNLTQYKEWSDDDFEAKMVEMENNPKIRKDFEGRIGKKLDEFAEDYDIDDLKINDREALRNLIQNIISLEDYEEMVYGIRSGEINPQNITVLDRLSKMMSDIRKDISKLQEDLNITRKIRKSDKESSVISYISNLKEQARQYYESKAGYIFCPECNMLLSTVWALYPEADNKITLKCNRTMDDGHKCGHKFTVTTKELLDNKGTNKPEITPESMT